MAIQQWGSDHPIYVPCDLSKTALAPTSHVIQRYVTQTTLTLDELDGADWPRMWDRSCDLAAKKGGTSSSTESNYDREIGRFWRILVEHAEAKESALQLAWKQAFSSSRIILRNDGFLLV